MAIKAQCDRCGALAEVIAREGRGGVQIPEDWREVKMRHPSDTAVVHQVRQLCPRCVTAFAQFFDGDGAVDGLLEKASLTPVDEEHEGWAGHLAPPEPEEEHEHDFDRLHGLCRCGSSYGDVMARTAALNGEVDDRDGVDVLRFAGVDPAAPFGGRIPVGQKTATCPAVDAKTCLGVYTRGELHQHMEREHGVAVAPDSDGCPFCGNIMKKSAVGAHIAQEHPGDWQAWSDEKNWPGRGGRRAD